MTIAADGRRSTLAFGLGLARHPRAPRRWAIGAYFEGARGLSSLGEMHVRRGRYIGVAPVPGGLANVCLVRPSQPGDPALRAIRRRFCWRELARRSAAARSVCRRAAGAAAGRPRTAGGRRAADARFDGLLLAGDAAGFIDPMTGDGLRFAIRGGELAADAALERWPAGGPACTRGWPRRAAPRVRARSGGSTARCARSSRRRQPSGRRVGARVWPGLLRASSARPATAAWRRYNVSPQWNAESVRTP